MRESATALAVGVLAVAVNTPLIALILSLVSLGFAIAANRRVNKVLGPLGRWVDAQAAEVAHVLPEEDPPDGG